MAKVTVTSVKVDEELWKEAKIQAIRDGVTLGELLNEALQARLTDSAAVKKLAAKYGKS